MVRVDEYGSWSRVPCGAPASVQVPASAAGIDFSGPHSVLPFGGGRTYGDTCVNSAAAIVDTRRMNRILAFDAERGRIVCEGGVTLAQVLERAVPLGWFPPVCPGTKAVTLGGAVAHDVHGKNHAHVGTIGCHVERLTLVRSDRGRVGCSPTEEPQLFAATIGGLGLTGLIAALELRLLPVASSAFAVTREAGDLDAFFARLEQGPRAAYAFTWVDSFAREPGARCLFLEGEHAPAGPEPPRAIGRVRTPAWVPAAAFNRASVRVFNALYYRSGSRAGARAGGAAVRESYDAFLFPQDSLHPSNRLYGRRGVLAFHVKLPLASARTSLPRLLARIGRPGDQSIVTVLKVFGERRSPGLVSFGGPGVSVACGFPNQGARTLALLAELDALVAEVGGIHYPAKDPRLPAAAFRRSFPRWRELAALADPRFSSRFWRRVAGDGEPVRAR